MVDALKYYTPASSQGGLMQHRIRTYVHMRYCNTCKRPDSYIKNGWCTNRDCVRALAFAVCSIQSFKGLGAVHSLSS